MTTGSVYPLALNNPGQNAQLSFSGTVNQVLTLDMSSVVTTPTTPIAIALKDPTGKILFSQMANGATTSITLPALPVTGTYTLFIEPATGGMKLMPVDSETGSFTFLFFPSNGSGAATASMNLLLH